ncbi:MAG: TAXI family TRAP transporter solute-binding subunit [Alphaproteobacteria bacterium]
MSPVPGVTAQRVTRRLFNLGLLAAGTGLGFAGVRGLLPNRPAASAQEVRYLRIGTGDVGGVYFRVGGILANMFSDPASVSECEGAGPCGVPGVVAVAQATGGSVDNVGRIGGGDLEAGLCQSDVAYWAYHGKEMFADAAVDTLRLVANLYSEAVHVVVAADSDAASIGDLAGRRVVVGAEGSGSLIGARIILAAYGLDLDRIVPIYENITMGVTLLEAGEADAVFVTSGAPSPSLMPLAEGPGFRLLDIDDAHVEAIRRQAPFFTRLRIPRDQYHGVGDTRTLAVGAQLFVQAALDEDVVFALTRALWHPSNRSVLNNGHPVGQRIVLEKALSGMTVPLHPGAARFYETVELPVAGPTELPADGGAEPDAPDAPEPQ